MDRIDETTFTWARCPYPEELCGAEATLTNILFPDDADVAWSAQLHCSNGHSFGIALRSENN